MLLFDVAMSQTEYVLKAPSGVDPALQAVETWT